MMRERLRLLTQTQKGDHIPKADRTWFWREFKRLRAAYPNWPYAQVWDALCWQLEHDYGVTT